MSYQAEGRQNEGGLFLLPWQRSGVMGCGQAGEDKRPKLQVKECSGLVHSPAQNPLDIFSLLKM